MSRDHLVAPRARGDREAIRVLLSTGHGGGACPHRAIGQLKALIVNAPEQLRHHL